MSEEKPEPERFTLNPSYLKAALDEAGSYSKAEPLDREVSLPGDAHRQEGKIHSRPVLSAQANAMEEKTSEPFGWAERTADPKRTLDGSLTADTFDHAALLATSKAAIASKKAEIARVREEIDSLSKGNDSRRPADLSAYQAELNELRLRRIAIQMALISDSDEYDDGDILAIDKRMKEVAESVAQARQSQAASTGIDAELLGLRAEEESLTCELRTLVADHKHWVAVTKAESYLMALKVAHRLQYELLALASLDSGEGPLRHLDLGGELPWPRGFETFASLLPGDLAITVAGVEEAKARLRSELGI